MDVDEAGTITGEIGKVRVIEVVGNWKVGCRISDDIAKY